EIAFVEYPIYPFGNNVTTHLLLNKKTLTIEMWVSRDGWGGTGVTHHGVVRLDEKEFELLHREIMNVKSPQDFQKISEIFEEIMEKRKEEFDKIVDDLVMRFIDASTYDNALTIAKDEEDIKRFVKSCIEEWLTT
ncbi:MAG: cytochrome P450, partial [Sulfolobales archaeon]|nr:cytochrome P450 [Sulfolobales archaeon]